MVKAYLRYELAEAFGVITSGANIVHDTSGKHVITAALENVAVWNLKQGSRVCISCSYRLALPGQRNTALQCPNLPAAHCWAIVGLHVSGGLITCTKSSVMHVVLTCCSRRYAPWCHHQQLQVPLLGRSCAWH